jgi:hypothetical protein
MWAQGIFRIMRNSAPVPARKSLPSRTYWTDPMIRFEAMPNEKPADTSAAKPAKASKASKSKAKTSKSASEQDLLDLPSDVIDEKD